MRNGDPRLLSAGITRIHYLDDPGPAFREFHRVLRPTGRFVFSTPRRPRDARLPRLDGSTGVRLTTIPGASAAVVANGWVFTTTDHYLNAYAP